MREHIFLCLLLFFFSSQSALPVLPEPEGPQAVIFMYHPFGESSHPSTNVTRSQLEEQLDFLEKKTILPSCPWRKLLRLFNTSKVHFETPARIAQIAVITHISYLILINLALNLALTQTSINRIKPDTFTLSWNRAWSLYPFHLQARGIDVNGQSRSQRWQVQSPAVSASISLLALLWHSVDLRNIEAQDVKYYQRPRPQADKNHSDIRAHFPPIKGRKLDVFNAKAKFDRYGSNVVLEKPETKGR